MSKTPRHRALRALPIVLGLGAAGLAVAASPVASVADPLRCAIHAETSNGMIALSGTVAADIEMNGSYRLTVAGPATNISQGGAFTVVPGRIESLGNVMVSSNGGVDARLEIQAGGATVTCDEWIGAI